MDLIRPLYGTYCLHLCELIQSQFPRKSNFMIDKPNSEVG